MIVDITPETNDYRLAGVAAYIDSGPGPGRVQYFSTSKPAPFAAAGGSPLVEMVLTDPCGSVMAHKLVLTQADVTGDLILIGGTARWGRIINSAGIVILDGDVTDDSGDGFFRVAGTSGTVLFAGARAILGVVGIE